jgi:DNA polymerase-3 subunit alpha
MKIIKKKSLGKQKVFDIGLEKDHNFILSNKTIAKNCFNKSHAIAYSFISYQTAWLKHYYPEEFYCSLFNNTTKEQDQLVKYIHSCKDKGIPIEPPDINRSDNEFKVDNGTIIFGLGGIKGVGEKACEHLLEVRPREGFKNLEQIIKLKINAGTLKALAASGALGEVTEHIDREKLIASIDSLIAYYNKLENWEERKKRFLQREEEKKEAIANSLKPPRSLPKLPDRLEMAEDLLSIIKPEFKEYSEIKFNKQDRLRMERETLGFYLSGHPLDDYPGLYQTSRWTIDKVKEEGENRDVIRIPVVVSNLTEKRTRKGKDMATAILEDRTGRIDTTIFPSTWKKIKNKIQECQVAIVTCNIDRALSQDEEHTVAKLILQDIEIVTDEQKNILSEPVITDIIIKLSDGAKVVFTPSSDVNLSHWQQAKAIADNMLSQQQSLMKVEKYGY